jgi:PPOX class probable F420-dependent enzyme
LLLTHRERQFLSSRMVGHLATASKRAVPHVVPICFAISDATLYTTVDQKPKRNPGTTLQRMKNIAENPVASVTVDRYDGDWTRLGWVMLRGRAEILSGGTEHGHAQALLRERYLQLQTMRIESLPVIAVRLEKATSWGNLDAE